MKTKFSGILTLILALVAQLTFAQGKAVSGSVSDDSGMPVAGVNIVVQGTTTGTQSDFDGNYSIMVDEGSVLSFTYVGYTSVTVTVGSSDTVNVTMGEDVAQLEEVVVTGSLIKRSDGFESASPVVVSNAADIAATGISKIEDFLNSLPQLEAGQNSYISNGATGTASLDLRGMGSSRTLTLINGRRMGGGSAYSSSADTNQIPTAMIERVEVLTGGASTTYGADAVAGVAPHAG